MTPDAATTPDRPEDLRACLRPDLFRALADPTRVEILFRLVFEPTPQTVTQVSSCCGVHLSGVSRHLAMLREAGVVQATRHGREMRYSLAREEITAALRGLADAIDGCRERCCGPSANPGCCPTETQEEK